jgi:cardiolipin synthase A/B
MAQFIDTATERLDVQHPKYVDAVILERLAAAADRGVKVLVVCGGKHGISEWDILDTFASLRTLKRFGVRVHKQKNLRVHAKLIVVDNAHTLVGSMNIDRSAFDLRRELGIMTNDPAIVGRLTEVFDSDWDLSHHYEAPDPLDPPQHHEDDFPHDQTAPGPSILIGTLVGYGAGLSVGGVPGAIVGGLIATVAMLLPAASLMYVITLFWQKA